MFGTKRQAITKHLANIFRCGELEEVSVSSILEYTASDGKSYKTHFYNLDAILSVGYRVNGVNATAFRRWATTILQQFLLRGYSINQQLIQMEDRIDRRLESQHDEIQRIKEIQKQQSQIDFFRIRIDTIIYCRNLYAQGLFQTYHLVMEAVVKR